MADVNANIRIDIDTSGAYGELRRLQSQISNFNNSLATSNASAAAQATALNKALKDGINASGMYEARIIPTISSVERFSTALEKNRLSLGEYTRYAASQLPGLSRVFRKEWDTMEQVATTRVKKLNAQYLALGRSAKGAQEVMQIVPTGLARGYSTDLAMATQKQQIFNKLIDDGSTKLLNWGKNTQWAGRQLMVGFSLPLAALGTVAAKTFMEIDRASTAFERVYGDLSTTTAEMERNKAAVKDLGAEYTKYGIAVKDTIDLAARVAATGAQNEDMITATEQTLRFATLGQMDYNQALDATISLQSAFNVSSKDLGTTIDYLNAVENQTVLTIQDMAAAIPRVAPVVQGLGGDVKDLAVMMTAMREGGVTAENAANALKSGLASLINPTNRAQESMAKLGIDMQAIIDTNRGDLLATVTAFGQALSKVDEFSQQQALEQIFGKYQYARMGALFNNIADGASQASRAMDLAGMSASELAQLSEKELGAIAESTTVKFEAAMERLKLSIAPLGEAFLKGVMPIMEFLSNIATAFNNLPDPIKNAAAVITAVVAGLGPVFLMTIGLIGNGIANLVKGIQFFRRTVARIKGDASSFGYLADAELEAKSASEQLEGSVTSLTTNLNLQRRALGALITQYGRYTQAAGIAATGLPTRRPAVKMARGGVVPGTGSGDKVPALLEPGETVVTKKASQKYGPVIAAMNAGNLPGYQYGLDEGITGVAYGPRTAGGSGLSRMSQSLKQYLETVENGQELQEEINRRLREQGRIKPLTTPDIKAIVREVTQQPEMFSARRAGRRTMGAPTWAREQSRAMYESGQFASEEQFIRARMGGDVSDDWFKIDASHIQKEVDEFGKKIWNASNLFPDFRGVNQTLEARMKSFDTAIQNGTISISDTAEMMRRETPELLRGLSSEDIERELDRLRQGIHPITEKATKVATSFAKLDASLSKTALEMGQKRTSLGTVAATGRNAEFFAAAGEYRLGEGREEYFGAGGRSQQRYEEQARRAGQLEVKARRQGMEQASTEQDDLFYGTRSSRRNSPHPQAAIDGRDDTKAYIAAQKAELASLRQASGMSAKQQYKLTQSEARRETRDAARMRAAGMTDTQIARTQKKLLATKIAELKAAQKSAVVEQQIAAAKTQTAVAEKKRSRMANLASGVGRRAGGIGMGLGMASMIPFMAQNEQGKFMGMDANAMGMGMMGAGMALEMVKFSSVLGIASKAAAALGVTVGALGAALGIATAAAAAVGIGLYLWRKNVDESARSAAKLGSNLGVAANAANNMATMLGKQTPAQMQAARLAGLTPEESQQAASEFQQVFESESGKQFIADLESATSEQRFKMLADYLRTAIATGMLDQTQAQNFGKAIAVQIGDGILGARVANVIKDQVAGLEGMVKLANERTTAIERSPAMAAVASGTAGTEQASSVIGSSIQAIQDWSNVSAIAKDEYNRGIISYSEMRSAVDASTEAQKRYTDATRSALSQGDVGGNSQAVKDSVVNAGLITEEKFDEIFKSLEATGGTSKTIAAGKGLTQKIAVPMSTADQDLLKSTWVSLLSQSMDPDEAKTVAQSVFEDPEMRGKFKGLIDAGLDQTKAAKALASDTGKLPETGVAGIFGKEWNDRLLEFKLTFPGEIEDLDAYLASLSQQELFEIAPTLKNLSPEDALKWVSDNASMAAKVGSGLANEIQKKVGPAGSADAEAAVSSAYDSKLWTDEEIEKIISVSLETPADFDEKMGQFVGYAKELSAIPINIRQVIGIDIANPEDLEKYGPMADDLNELVPAIEAIPEGQREFAVGFMFTENGKVKDPVKFAKDWKSYQKTLSGLSSDKLKVRKESAIELAVLMYDQNGVQISPDQAKNMISNVIQDLGISEKEFLQLPPDTISKVFQIQLDLQMKKEDLDAAREYYKFAQASGNARQSDEAYVAWKAAQTAYAAAQKTAASDTAAAVGAGIVEGGNELPKDSSGGGGDKANPWKDFLKSLVEQVKTFSNINATVKNILSGKNDFLSLLKQNNGIDDKIRKMGLSPLLAEQIRAMDPDAANKVLAKIKDVGKRKIEDIALANQVNVEKDTLTGRIGQASAQRRASMSLAGRGVKGDVIQSIASDPTASATYLSFVKRVNQLENQMGEASGRRRKQLKKEWQDAKRELREYLQLYSKANVSERAQEYEADKVSRGYDVGSKGAVLERLKAAGISQQEIDAIMSNGAVVGKLNDAIRAGTGFNNVLKEQLALIQQEAQFEWNLKSPLEQLSEILDAQQAVLDARKALDEFNMIKPIQDEINGIQKVIDGIQAQNDELARKIELRQRDLEGIDDQISKLEEEKDAINKAYDERLKALDAIEQANERIYAQQRGQLSIAQALSVGDVAGAAKAMQDLQIKMAQDRQQSTRDALELARQRQLEEIDARINILKDQRKAIEEDIKNLQVEQRRNNDKIYQQQQLIKVKNDQIKKLQDEINAKYQNNELALARINNQLDAAIEKWKEIKRLAGIAMGAEAGTVTSAPASSTASTSTASPAGTPVVQNSNGTYTVYAMGTAMTFKSDGSGGWTPVATGGLIKKYSVGGNVFGNGSRDTVPAMLTPGEFVMRKAAVDKFGSAMFQSLNMGSMPRFNVPAGSSYSVGKDGASAGGAVYNYEISVNVPNTNASPDEIANVVLSKIKMQDDKRIRSNRF